MILKRSKTKDGVEIVLWDFDYGIFNHFYSIMTYPIAIHTDYDHAFGARRGERFCLEIEFKELKEAEECFNKLETGAKTILDYKANVVNQDKIKFVFDTPTEFIEKFNSLLGDWDYRNNLDMTKPHLGYIILDDSNIHLKCEKYSPDIDDYVFCDAGIIVDNDIFNQFTNLDLSDKEATLDLIKLLESHIDWEKTEEKIKYYGG